MSTAAAAKGSSLAATATNAAGAAVATNGDPAGLTNAEAAPPHDGAPINTNALSHDGASVATNMVSDMDTAGPKLRQTANKLIRPDGASFKVVLQAGMHPTAAGQMSLFPKVL